MLANPQRPGISKSMGGTTTKRARRVQASSPPRVAKLKRQIKQIRAGVTRLKRHPLAPLARYYAQGVGQGAFLAFTVPFKRPRYQRRRRHHYRPPRRGGRGPRGLLGN